MMDRAIRRAAVRAAAKTAIVLSLGGCALSHEPVVATDGATAPDVPTDCASYLASLPLTADMWTASFTREEDRSAEQTFACCLEMEAAFDPTTQTWPPPSLAYACCEVLVGDPRHDGFSPLGCTPWGPPCPPEMV